MKRMFSLYAALTASLTITGAIPCSGSQSEPSSEKFKGTTQTALVYVSPERELIDPTLSQNLYIRYSQELSRNRDAITDNIGLQSYPKWLARSDNKGFAIHEALDRAGANAMFDLLGDSAAETALGLLPTEEWEERGRIIGEGLVGLFVGTVGNTVERRMTDDPLVFEESRDSWLYTAENAKTVKYGFRPLRADPYAYVTSPVGHWGDKNRPVMILNTRLIYSDFEAGRIRQSVTVPITDSLRLSGSIATDLLKGNGNIRASGRIEKFFGRGPNLKALFAAISTGGEQTLATAGYIAYW